MSAGEAVPRPQVPSLRHRRIPLLHTHRVRHARLPSSGLLLEGEGIYRGLQRGVHSHAAALSAPRLRQGAHRVQLRALQDRGQDWHAREASLRSRSPMLPTILVYDYFGHSYCTID